jgi:hypothetical protein
VGTRRIKTDGRDTAATGTGGRMIGGGGAGRWLDDHGSFFGHAKTTRGRFSRDFDDIAFSSTR